MGAVEGGNHYRPKRRHRLLRKAIERRLSLKEERFDDYHLANNACAETSPNVGGHYRVGRKRTGKRTRRIQQTFSHIHGTGGVDPLNRTRDVLRLGSDVPAR